ncbi:16S rRNA (uracil(1498)-N(3))-methyltransferase [Haloglycomyces albus]|uniref:16S rRNA (uracil(1498)-N(3))-methyltransferase n=1 Tax=Haloglycomyces albus TaxID=526067 RepID=UPI00046CE88A|nr:16S rRNA (uracil(1498)-N(3))-methyltransferase [Haloglycomyces albus]
MTEPFFLIDQLPSGNAGVLDGPEGHHAADVQRLRVGERLSLTDGHGNIAHSTVTGSEKARLEYAIDERIQAPRPIPSLTLVQALPKGDRGERAVQEATEIGVDSVIPWAAARSIVQWKGARGEKSRRKWATTAREAAKQARRPWVPLVEELYTTKQLVSRLRQVDQVIIAHEDATEPLSQVSLADAGEIAVIIGPEGSLTPDEVKAFSEFSNPVRLGETILRTSTAGPAILSVLQARLGRW